MHQAPMQDNNRLQQHNPRHPANVANRTALARVASRYPANAPRMEPAGHGEITRAHEINREHPNTTFFTPRQNRAASKMYRHNASPIERLGNPVERFLGLRDLGKQLTSSFNPTTRAGLLNTLSMFAGGPKGDASPMMGKLGMPGQFRDYGGAEVNPLSRGVEREGPSGGKGAGIRGLARRAEGVGGYRQPNRGLTEMNRIEAIRKAQSKIAETNDKIREYSNRTGFQNKQQAQRIAIRRAYERESGGSLTPYMPHHQGNEPTVGNHDIQPHDYTDRLRLLKLQKQQPGNEMLGNPDVIMRALYDMLFSGKGFPNAPRRP